MISLALGLGVNMGGSSGFDPSSVFAGNAAGMWLDQSDITTGFQDSVGTTPQTASGQQTGLRLDKRLGLATGPDLIVNGDFSAGTAGWTNNGTATFTVNSGVATVAFNGGTARVYQSITTVVGQWYRVTSTLKTSPGIGAFSGVLKGDSTTFGLNQINCNTASAPTVADQTGNAYFVATATTTFIGMQNNAGSANFANISCRMLAGNHVLQATGSARPEWDVISGISSDFTDGLDDGYSTATFVAGTLTSNMDCFIALKRATAAQMAPISMAPVDGSNYFGVMVSGSGVSCASTVGTAWSAYVDGSIVGAINSATRGQIHTAMTSGAYHVMEFRDLDLSTWTQFTLGLYTTFMLNADIGGVILCPAQSTANRNALRKWLGAKVGLSL